MTRHWMGLLIVGAAWLACLVSPARAGDSMTQAADDWQRLRLDGAKGLIAMRVVANARVSSAVGALHHAWVRNVDTRREWELRNFAPGYAKYSYLIGDVPAGTYELVAVGKNLLAKSSRTERVVPLGAAAGLIKVDSGKVTDLGTLYFSRVLNPPDATAFQWAFDQDEGTFQRIRDELPPVLRAALDRGALAWGPAASGLQRPKLTSREWSRTRLLLDPVLTPDGRLVAGEAFGQLSIRDRDGQWFREKLPTMTHILTTSTLPDGTFVAGASEGRILSRRPGGEWRLGDLPRGSAAPRMIAWHDSLKIVVIADVPGGVEIYRSDSPDGSWQLLGRLAVPYGAGPVPQPLFGIRIVGDQLTIVTANNSTNTLGGNPRIDYRVNTYSIADGKWTNRPLWSGSTELVMARDGRLFGNSIGLGYKQTFLMSDDLGEKWRLQPVPQYTRYVTYRTEKSGYLIQIDNVGSQGRLFYDDSLGDQLSLNAEKVKHRVWATRDGGLQWTPAGEVPKDTTRLVPLADDGQLLAITFDNVVLSSKDSGRTWVQELP